MSQDYQKKNKSSSLLIFTDLDGTLLDHDSYRWDAAEPALSLCRDADIPVIIVSSKTGAEIEVIQKDMNLKGPFISENGGGIFFPGDFFKGKPSGGILYADGKYKLILGKAYDFLVSMLAEISSETGIGIRGFSGMSRKEIIDLTGLSADESIRASERDFDEPFIIMDEQAGDIERIRAASGRRGLRISEGGRFYHLHGLSDKENAVRRFLSIYEDLKNKVFSIALGDSPNDFGMFKAVDQAVLVRSKRHISGAEEKFPGIIITENHGPEGWNRAVLSLIKTKREDASNV